MSLPPIPVDARIADWPRKVANAINRLLVGSVMKDGTDIYAAPTASATYDQAQMQAVMDAVEALSARLK